MELFRLVTGARRWQANGAVIFSGAQSALAGKYMLTQAAGGAPVGIADIAPYAAFGALYFLISAVSLTNGERRANLSAAK